VELVWVFRFLAARRRGRKAARIVRQQREALVEGYTFTGRHALHEAATP